MKCFQKYIPQKETPMDMRLDITFHDPNTPEDTYKMVTKVFSEAWVKRLIDDMKSGKEQDLSDWQTDT